MHANPLHRRGLLQQGVAAAAALLGLDHAVCAPVTPRLEQLHILCTGPAGSVPDTVARRVADQLAGRLAERVVIENRPGAAGQIAVTALKTSRPDGATLLLAQGAIATVYPFLYPKLAYDAAVDLKPVSLAGEMTLGLAVGPAVPDSVADVSQLIAWMRRNPARANVGSPGSGTLPHLLEAMLFAASPVDWQHVVYAGGPPALVDLMGGQIAALVLPEGLLRQHRAAGKLRVLATSGATRSVHLPDVPSLAEQGFRNLVVREWFAFFMHGSTANAVVESTSEALGIAIAQPALAASFADAGMVAASSTPASLATRIAAEQRYWAPVIRASNIRAE